MAKKIKSPSNKEEKTAIDKKFILRVDTTIVDRIDTIRKSSMVKISRNSWITQAILNQLEKEEKEA